VHDLADDGADHDDGSCDHRDRVVAHPAPDAPRMQILACGVQASALLLDTSALVAGVRRAASGHGSSLDVEDRAYRDSLAPPRTAGTTVRRARRTVGARR
jgi:hypothetical protein